MYQRDVFLDEIRKMALVIAKLMGLKVAGDEREFIQEFNNTLLHEFDTEAEVLLALSEEDFEGLIKSDKYSKEKLNALAQMLYMFAEPFQQDEATQALLKKVMIVFNVLEEKHHYQTFENITKRNTIYKYFNIS